MFTTTYKDVEFTAPERRYLALLQGWFDGLENGEVKERVVAVKWREMRPPLSWFRLVVLCRAPNVEDVEAYRKSKKQDDTEIIADAAIRLQNNFAKWITLAAMPSETIIDERPAWISWSDNELTYFDVENFNPQQRAQFDLNRQATNFLWLVEVSTQEKQEFVRSIVGSNTPFSAAGSLLSGHVRMVNRFPPDFPGNEEEKDRLHDNLLEHPADFMILMRLADHFDCRQPLVEHAMAVRRRFLATHAANIPKWLKESERIEEEEDFLGCEPQVEAAFYEALDVAWEAYRQDLLGTIKGRESELGEILGSFLPELPIPDTPFADELRDEGDWWKRGEE